MSLFKELKYQFSCASYGELRNYITIFGKLQENGDVLLSFQHNSQIISGCATKDKNDNSMIYIEVMELFEYEMLKMLYYKDKVVTVMYKLDKELNCIGQEYNNSIITDKYVMSDLALDFKNQHKSTNKILEGERYNISKMVTW